MAKSVTWQSVILIGVIGALVVALAAVTDWDTTQILAVAGVLAGIGAGQVAGQAATGGVSQQVETLQIETAQQSEKLETIERRTNGELDARIAAAMDEAAEMGAARVISELRAQGVLR